MMTKDQIIIQRTIGKILTKLNEQDGIMLTQYMAMLEELVYDLKMTPKPTIETGMVRYHEDKEASLETTKTVNRETRGRRPLKSKSFTENEIHFNMFLKVKGDSCKDERGKSFVMQNITDLEDLNYIDYSLLRNRVLANLHSQRKKANV